MGYQALLFCPDEKTARTVTQVLGELEFTIESCSEPFAAVKKLMGQHFDAVVVDCDNEQNATLLFKSARNSTSNQGSLAVAVVEGQAGVAKAFRIGANLVLTKPINIEQAKGTLRVARGLLRKGDPSKPAAAASATLVPAASAAKPVAAKPVPPAIPAPAPLPAAVSTPRPAEAAQTQAKPVPSTAWPAPAAASSARPTQVPDALVQEAHFQEAKNQIAREQSAQDDDVLEIMDDSMAAPPAAAGKTASPAGLPPAFGRGAASAPAPAREAHNLQAAEVSSQGTLAGADVQVDKLEEATQSSSSQSASSYAGSEPSFTFGGSNVPEQSSGGSKKIFLGIAAAAIVIAVIYFGWTQFLGSSRPASTPTPVTSAPVAPAQTAKPGRPQPATPAPSAAKPTASVASPSALRDAVPAAKPPADDTDSASDAAAFSAPRSASSIPSSTAAGKIGAAAAAEPFVVKGGTARATSAAAAAPDAPAPSMAGIATSGEGTPPPDLVGNAASATKPILQTMNVSQGVSRGLLIKKVQPVYPRNALSLRIEGAVELMATISKTGDIAHIKILSGDSQLTRAAAEAVKQWKYKPYLLNGEPVEIQTQVTINFKLPN